MGFFSWETADTKKPVRNRYTDDGPTPCKMLDDAGNVYTEKNYDGYGEFGGVDFYELTDRMNGGTGDRDRGIHLALDNPGPGVKLPKIVSMRCTKSYAELPDSPMATCQGYW